MKRLSDRPFQWIFYLTASFYFGATFLRAILIFRDSPELLRVLGSLMIWLILFISEPGISNRWASYFPVYLALQTAVIFSLLGMPGYTDFFANLFAILSMQAMFHLSPRVWAAWIGICAGVTTMLLAKTYESQTYALVLLYTAGYVFYGFFARAIRRAQATSAHNWVLAQELEEANQKLKTYSIQLEQLAVARERNRLARDLHDSVTQIVFSMTLATQSASLLLGRDSARVAAQLDRLSQLAQNALSEMQFLISELKSEETGKAGLVTNLRRYLAGAHFPENLSISLDVQGEGQLKPAEEHTLFHIVQEALNNIVKHSQASKAQVRLHLNEPMWIEIEDCGQGFDLQRAHKSGRVGLLSMRERAAELGWDLKIRTSPGAGTCVRVEKLPEGVMQI